ncbi:Flagellar hook-associated protein FlgK [Roseibacterium elongatum DSM 19469]|uniref:Flagellar hook-associated protein 1 n=1 Tax=Roseicyclus elongatus DSM 19469 TaxID=1294273 RepID=W8RRB9_9RHOB|nr:flagellar hook-associated protein FlgK [Roseibacterium elongatum]AHM03729.1 Flagellar hook-associated protein FlgK [Roseibacterium elongatum DSM 19469]
MSISSTLSNALSGLTVAGRAADVVSSNIANAMTEGYGVRRLEVSARITGNAGAGAQIGGILRQEDLILLGQRRLADADLAALSTEAGFMTRLENLIGTPDAPGSLSSRLAEFEATLVGAANAPHSQTQLAAAVEAAGALATQINDISDGIQAERLQADTAIARSVDRINGALRQIADLNTQIRSAIDNGGEAAALMDAQAALVEEIAPQIPLQARRDASGALYLYSRDGEALVDGQPATLGFTPVSVMAADMTRTSGTLSGLTLNGRDLRLDGATPALAGGELAALFELRDGWGVAAQGRIDAVARDLAERLQAPGLDPTGTAGGAGLFTDTGARVDPATEVGLAGRLRLNAALDPAAGGAVWRLRDGLGAASEGAPGNAAFLTAQLDALSALRPTQSGGFSTASRSMAGLVSDHLSLTGLARQTAETDAAHAGARQSALKQEELARGVDTDAEMQRLLQIEQMFAANARVMQAAEEMIDELMRIGA